MQNLAKGTQEFVTELGITNPIMVAYIDSMLKQQDRIIEIIREEDKSGHILDVLNSAFTKVYQDETINSLIEKSKETLNELPLSPLFKEFYTELYNFKPTTEEPFKESLVYGVTKMSELADKVGSLTEEEFEFLNVNSKNSTNSTQEYMFALLGISIQELEDGEVIDEGTEMYLKCEVFHNYLETTMEELEHLTPGLEKLHAIIENN